MPRIGSTTPTAEDIVDAEVVEDIGELVEPTKAVARRKAPANTQDLFVAYDETEEHLNLLYWGREGSGKTIDLAAATQRGRVLFINAEGGLKKRALLANGANTSNLVLFPRPGQPLNYYTLQEALFRVKADLMDDPNAWFLVAVDSVTELATAFTDAAADDRFEKGKLKNKEWKPTITDEFFTDRDDYGVSTKMVRKLARFLRDLPCHTAMTTLERRDVDEKTSTVAYGPAVGPALQTSLLGYVDVVLYCKAPDEDKDYFRAMTKNVGTARAKDRIGVMPKILVNPTVLRVLDYNEGILTEDTDPEQEPVRNAPEKPKKAGPVRRRPAAKKVTEAKGDPSEPQSEAGE